MAAFISDVPAKNLKRWIEKGIGLKRGGRKTQDPQMEVKLTKWIDDFRNINKDFPNPKLIKKMALEYSNFKNTFKASKGWYEKFIRRNFSENMPQKKKVLERTCGNSKKEQTEKPVDLEIYKSFKDNESKSPNLSEMDPNFMIFCNLTSTD